MNWQDEGYIVGKKKFSENAIILDVFTKNFGKVSAIVYGGTSRKIKNYLQLANKIFVVFNSKSNNKLGYFKTELIEAISPKYFSNKKKTICINSLSSIIKVLLPENENQIKIYSSLESFIHKMDENNWILHYLNWEIDLINYLGFGFNIDSRNYTENTNSKIIDVKLDDVIYKIPFFLINKNLKNTGTQDIFAGLSFSRSLMENKFFIPNNLNFPYSRRLLERKIL